MVWNPFRAELAPAVRSSGFPAEYGHPGEEFAMPQTVTLDDSVWPDETGISGGPSAYRSNVGDVFQASNPEYAGGYLIRNVNSSGPMPDTSAYTRVPAAGSADLQAPRDAGSVTGTNTLLISDGPVGGESLQWTGARADLHRPVVGNAGPVAGGPDYSQQAAQAYFQQEAALYSRQYADAAMIAAI